MTYNQFEIFQFLRVYVHDLQSELNLGEKMIQVEKYCLTIFAKVNTFNLIKISSFH